jgi:DnaJ-class molecular chaperone
MVQAADEINCASCEGTGTLLSVTCRDCDGTGQIRIERKIICPNCQGLMKPVTTFQSG